MYFLFLLRKQYLYVLLCLLGWYGSAGLYAQEYNFVNISVADGLAQSQVYALCEDRRGTLWFGTRGGGLSRFDGKNFTTFSEEDGLLSNYTRCLLEDRNGRLWIGTDQGISLYDGHRFAGYSRRNGLDDYLVNALVQDSSGNVWIGTEQGSLLRFDRDHFVLVLTPKQLPGRKVYSLTVDSRGKMWIGTDNGLVCYDGNRTQVYTSRDGLATNIIQDVAEDEQGHLWIATYGGGVTVFDGQQFVTYRADNGLSNQTVLCAMAANGAMWFGTAGGGVNRFDGRRFTVFTEAEGLCNNVVTAMLKASDGTLWFGSSGGGVSRFDGERFVHFTQKSGAVGNWVYSVLEDDTGALWFGSSPGGVTKYDGQFYTRYTARNGFTAAKVRCSMQDSRGRLWFGTVGDGIYVYDFKTFKRLGANEGLKARFINAISEDEAGNFWIATSDAGLLWYRPRNREPVVVLGRETVGTVRIHSVLAIAPATVWVATDGAGLYKISYRGDSLASVQAFTTRDGLPSGTIRSVVRYDEALLFGTGGGGVVVYNNGRFTTIRRQDGISSNNIYSVLADGKYIWLGTERGIDRIFVDSTFAVRESRHYGRAEGITGVETAQNAVYRDRQGNIWFGTIHGVVKYNPHEDRPNNIPPKTHITEMRLFFENITATPFADSVTPWYPLPVGLVLPYDQNHVSFDVVGISLRNPDAVRYQWKLAGFDRDWTPVTEQRTAVFSNLPPGQYTLYVRSFNEDGVVDPTPATCSFVITPPFWATWWFLLLVGLVATASIGLGFRSRLNAVRRRNERERAELDTRRTIVELEQKALRLSMNPHFIFNALNAVQGFITQNESTAARRYLAKFAKLMRAILENSRVSQVSLGEEVAMLEQYLALERLLLNDRFNFDIRCDEVADAEVVFIPPMLIQPLVENAIRHGVAHRTEPSSIQVQCTFDGTLLHCTVSDNGVGRKRAQELRQAMQPEHSSTALDVIRERLVIMSRQTGTNARLEIHDLYDSSGVSAGTQADVWIPVVDVGAETGP